MLSSTDVEGLPEWLSCKESACNVGIMGSISRSGRPPGEGNSKPLQYSCLGIPWTEVPGEHLGVLQHLGGAPVPGVSRVRQNLGLNYRHQGHREI